MSADPKTKTTTSAPVDQTVAITNFWTQWMEQSARGTQALLEAMQEANDPSVWQKRWLSAMEDSFEDFMRTPSYMEMMRRALKTMTDMKVAQDQMVQGTARHLGMPLADDITGLFERLHSHEHTILAQLKEIEERLKAIEEALEANGAGPRGKSAAK